MKAHGVIPESLSNLQALQSVSVRPKSLSLCRLAKAGGAHCTCGARCFVRFCQQLGP